MIFIYTCLAFVLGFLLGLDRARRAFDRRLDRFVKNSVPSESPEADERGASAEREEASAISENPLELSGHFDSKSPHTITSGLLCHGDTKRIKTGFLSLSASRKTISRQYPGLLYRGGTKRA